MFRFIVPLVILLTATSAGHAQPVEPAQSKTDDFWFSTPRRRAATAAQLALAQDPLTLATLRHKSLKEMVWGEMEIVGDFAPPLNPEVLENVRDHRPLPDLRARHEDEISRSDRAIYRIYNQALVNAFYYPLEAFRESAAEHEHIKFAHLWNEPNIHRGKVISVTGRLYRLRKYEAPQPAQDDGVKYLYEGWVFAEPKGSHPYCIIFPIKPDSLPIAEKMDRTVTFYGYFLMRYKYRAQKGDLETPLLIGPTVVPLANPPSASSEMTPFPVFALVMVAVILAGIVAGIMVISWWFRRGDSRVQSRLDDLQDRRVREMLDESPEWKPPPS